MGKNYKDIQSSAIMSVLMMHLVIIAVVMIIPYVLWNGDLVVWGSLGLVVATVFFGVFRNDFRFQVPENSVYVVTWDNETYSASPGAWWKAMGADVKEDNKFSAERQTTTGKDTIPCKDGERLEANYGIQWSVVDAAIFNAVGKAATEKRIKSHAEKFFGELARNGGAMPKGETLLLKKDEVAQQFEHHFEIDGGFIIDLARRFGVKVELGYFETPLDYDEKSKASLAKKYEQEKLADAEQYRRKSIADDAQASGITDQAEALKIFAAIDGQSDVSMTGFNLAVDIKGLDPEAAKALADLLKANPALAGAFAAKATKKKGE